MRTVKRKRNTAGGGNTTTVSLSNFVGYSTVEEIRDKFGTCEVVCLDKQRRLWIVPTIKDTLVGFSVLRTSYVGDDPKEIGFAPSAEVAREYFSENNGIPPTAWRKCLVFSMLNPAKAMV